jgi:hypothetical protein
LFAYMPKSKALASAIFSVGIVIIEARITNPRLVDLGREHVFWARWPCREENRILFQILNLFFSGGILSMCTGCTAE